MPSVAVASAGSKDARGRLSRRRSSCGLSAQALVLLASFSSARAQPLPSSANDPGLYVVTKPGDAPTSWACNAATLATGEKCVFEGTSKPPLPAEKQGAANFAAAVALAPEACARAAATSEDKKGPKELRDLCAKDFKKAASAECNLAGAAALLDGKARFTPEAKACYLALGEVLRTVNRMAATASACCRCALSAKCIASAHACYRFIAEDPPVLPRCAATDCREECGHLLPEPVRGPDAGMVVEPLPPPADRTSPEADGSSGSKQKSDDRAEPDQDQGPRHPPARPPRSR
jgi:hypothetical protein